MSSLTVAEVASAAVGVGVAETDRKRVATGLVAAVVVAMEVGSRADTLNVGGAEAAVAVEVCRNRDRDERAAAAAAPAFVAVAVAHTFVAAAFALCVDAAFASVAVACAAGDERRCKAGTIEWRRRIPCAVDSLLVPEPEPVQVSVPPPLKY